MTTLLISSSSTRLLISRVQMCLYCSIVAYYTFLHPYLCCAGDGSHRRSVGAIPRSNAGAGRCVVHDHAPHSWFHGGCNVALGGCCGACGPRKRGFRAEPQGRCNHHTLGSMSVCLPPSTSYATLMQLLFPGYDKDSRTYAVSVFLLAIESRNISFILYSSAYVLDRITPWQSVLVLI